MVERHHSGGPPTASHYETRGAVTRTRGLRPLCEPAGGVWQWWWRRWLWRRRRSDHDSNDRHKYDKYDKHDNYDNVGRLARAVKHPRRPMRRRRHGGTAGRRSSPKWGRNHHPPLPTTAARAEGPQPRIEGPLQQSERDPERRWLIEIAAFGLPLPTLAAVAVAALVGPFDPGRGPLEAGPDLVGLQVGHRPPLPLGGLPAPLAQPAGDHDPIP